MIATEACSNSYYGFWYSFMVLDTVEWRNLIF